MKACPRCGTPAPLDAAQCAKCGHAFRTKFDTGAVTPPSPPQTAKTPAPAPSATNTSPAPIPNWMLGLAAIGALMVVAFAINLLMGRSGRAKEISPEKQKVLLAWLAEKDGNYLRSPLDGKDEKLLSEVLERGVQESFFISIGQGGAQYLTVVTRKEQPEGTLSEVYRGRFDGSTWQTPDGLKTMHFDGTGLLEVDGKVYYKVPEVVTNFVDLSIIHTVREDIIAGKDSYYDFPN